MPLDDLVSVIETLQQRIRDHGPTLRENEIRTRMALIDPLLTALGWDVSDPALVTPEYSVDGGWADYALRGPGNQPAAIVEAKRLGTLVENHLSQMVNYCIQEGIAYAGVTDGSHWQLYRTFEPVPMADKIVLDVNISNTRAYECALQLLLLWRPNLASGRPVVAEEPVLVTKPEPAATTPSDEPARVPFPQTNLPPVSPTPPSAHTDGWESFSSFAPQSGKQPSAIRFFDDTELTLQSWRHMMELTTRWLWSTGRLTASNAEVASSNQRFIVNTQPIHPMGNNFIDPVSVSDTPLFVEGNVNRNAAVNNTKRLLNHCNVSPDDVWLRVER